MIQSTTPVEELKNIGYKTAEWLKEIDIHTLDDLERAGIAEVYGRLKEKGHPVSVNLAYALQGAILNIHWSGVPSELREELRVMVGEIGAEETEEDE
jgi:DNA transformation protein and related proteins